MKKTAILAVSVIGMTSIFAATADAHTLTFNRAVNGAFKIARSQCNSNATGSLTGGQVCFYFQAGPGASSVFKHKVTVPIHLVSGTPGDPAAQTDCHRDVKILIKKLFGLKLFFRFLTPYTCAPNVEHTGISAPRGALGGTP